MNKILIYTYRPFDSYKTNAAKDLVSKISTKGIKKIILKPNYNLSRLYREIRKSKPDIVLGIGQCAGKEVRVESEFHNRMKEKGLSRKIGREKTRKATLPAKKLAKSLGCKVSKNPEERNCNFSAYKLLGRKSGPKITFLHVPSRRYFKTKEYLPKFEKMLEQLRDSRARKK